MSKYIIFIALVLCSICLANSAPTVSNVTANQRTDGSGIVDIEYTLNDADGDNCEVSLEVSSDGGSTWDITPSAEALTGDIGKNISPGNKHIEWDSKVDLPGSYGTENKIKIIADDLQYSISLIDSWLHLGDTYWPYDICNSVPIGLSWSEDFNLGNEISYAKLSFRYFEVHRLNNPIYINNHFVAYLPKNKTEESENYTCEVPVNHFNLGENFISVESTCGEADFDDFALSEMVLEFVIE